MLGVCCILTRTVTSIDLKTDARSTASYYFKAVLSMHASQLISYRQDDADRLNQT